MNVDATNLFRLARSPPADVTKRDTGLRFTDILFGFVIREIFLRLQQWNDLDAPSQWQLIACSALVLGSWIGFRRSVHRSDYELKFFNLPLGKFVIDQLMIILYFRVSVTVPDDDPAGGPAAGTLAVTTAWNLLLVFVLYVVWDLLGIWMAVAKDRHATDATASLVYKYPQIDGDEKLTIQQLRNWPGLVITVAASTAVGVVWKIADMDPTMSDTSAVVLLVALVLVLLMYRFAKDVRTSWRSQAASTP